MKRSIALGLSSLVCLARLAAQPPTQQSIEKVSVEGTVVDASTGSPIDRALVRFGQESQFTGPEGRFVFQGDAKTRNLPIYAIRPGYEREVSFAFDENSAQPRIVKLQRYAEITGKVLNGDGEPVQGLRVQAYRRRIESGRERLRQSSFSTTDDLGSFRLAEMPTGEYLVRVRAQQRTTGYLGEMGNRGPGTETYIAQYYPGGSEKSSAQVLKMAPGQALQLDFTVASRPAVSVRGRIMNHIP